MLAIIEVFFRKMYLQHLRIVSTQVLQICLHDVNILFGCRELVSPVTDIGTWTSGSVSEIRRFWLPLWDLTGFGWVGLVDHHLCDFQGS